MKQHDPFDVDDLERICSDFWTSWQIWDRMESQAHKKMRGGIEIWPNIWVLLKELAHNNMMIVVNFVHTITYV